MYRGARRPTRRCSRAAVSAVAAIGVGAFAVSFLALRDLMREIGCSSGRANAPGRSLTCPFACHQGAQRLAGQEVAEGHREATRSALDARGVRP